MIKIAPSLLSADFTRLGEEIKDIEAAGADLLHIDVMDGHFVPNLTVGVPVVASLKGKTKLPLEVHLMIDNPDKFIEPFAQAGADILTFHIETVNEPEKTIKTIKDSDVKPGIALNPATPLTAVEDNLLDMLDMVLLMTVNPGFGGQKFIPEVLPKIKALKDKIQTRGLTLDIAVDGGISKETAPKVISAGANLLVAGTSVFSHTDRKLSIQALRD